MVDVSVAVMESFPKELKSGVGVTATFAENTAKQGKEEPRQSCRDQPNQERHRHTDGRGIDDSIV